MRKSKAVTQSAALASVPVSKPAPPVQPSLQELLINPKGHWHDLGTPTQLQRLRSVIAEWDSVHARFHQSTGEAFGDLRRPYDDKRILVARQELARLEAEQESSNQRERLQSLLTDRNITSDDRRRIHAVLEGRGDPGPSRLGGL